MNRLFFVLASVVFLLMIGVFFVTFSGFFTTFPRTQNSSDEPGFSGQITGMVKYHPAIKGDRIQERNLIVWLPPGYEDDPEIRYPVLYMQDGQNIFDPATSFIGIDWQVDETADSLIRSGEIPPLIIVGIFNTSDRTLEYTPGDIGSAYMDFVVHTIKPLIDSTYRTKTDREYTFAGGASAGGILAFMLVWEYPDVFSKAISMSPAFRNPDGFSYEFNFVQTVQNARSTPDDVFFYIDNGGVDLDALLQPGIDEMLLALDAHGYRLYQDFVFVKDDLALHNESAWAVRFPNALKLLMSNGLP
jgi:predicted alpha/beta superfamily hydrolase